MNMKRVLSSMIVCGLALAIAASALAAPIELRLKDGTRWRGQVSDLVKLTILENGKPVAFEGKIATEADLYITVEGMLLGKLAKKTIFKSDIIAISTLKAGDGAPVQPAEATPVEAVKSAPGSGEIGAANADRDDKTTSGGKKALLVAPKPGVFVLPLGGMVGLEFRHQEMEKIAKEADKYGPGQIIVLLIDSGGGRVDETEKIHEVLMRIREKHRLVGWIKKAISAACATALHCHEIYFMTEGTAGSMTAYAGDQSWQGKELERWLKSAGDWAEAGGRSRYIAESMIHAPVLLSYDKDPATGNITWHNDLSGNFILSRADENLTFNSSNAVHCGFADGIADTEADMAKLLDLPEWYEINSYGRDLVGKWVKTVETANEELPLLFARYKFKGTGTGDPEKILGIRINLLKQIIDWWERCPNACEMKGVPPRGQLEQEIDELKKALADMKKARARGR